MEKKITKTQIWIFILTIIYVLAFAVYYLINKNYEFIIYIGVLVFFITLIIAFHLKFNFTTGSLLGISIWGLMHMAGGSLYFNGIRLYDLWLLPILKYDQFVHFYCYIFVILLVYQILKNYINEKKNGFVISVFLVLIGMGIGSLNEIIEFSAVLFLSKTGVGDYFNTSWDLVFNTLGALVAVIYIRLKENFYKG